MKVMRKKRAKDASKYPMLSWKVLFTATLLIAYFDPLMAAHDLTLNDHWNITGDFVYMRRQHSTGKSLIYDLDKKRFCPNCDDFAVLRTSALINDQRFEPGFRVGVTYRNNPKMSLEANFLWVNDWDGHKEKKGDASLFFGFKDINYDGDYIFANEAKGDYDTGFWTTEANYWRHWTPRNIDYFSLSGIFGLRYFHFNESFVITYMRPAGKSHYKIHTKSDAFGVQAGLDFQVNPTKTFSWEIFAKFGLMIDHEEQKQLLKDLDDTVTLRNLKQQKWQNGCFADVAAWLVFQFKDHLNFHFGYEMIFLSSVATAEDQMGKRLTSGDGKQIDPNGAVIIHGLLGGMTISF